MSSTIENTVEVLVSKNPRYKKILGTCKVDDKYMRFESYIIDRGIDTSARHIEYLALACPEINSIVNSGIVIETVETTNFLVFNKDSKWQINSDDVI